MQYFNIIGACASTVHRLKIYQIHKFTMVNVGKSYKFSNCLVKNDGLWVVSGSSIGYIAPVNVDESLKVPNLPEEEPRSGQKRSLAQALGSPARSSITAKIVKVSPVKFRREGTLAVRTLGLKDESGLAKVALFSNLAEETYERNATIELTAVYQKMYDKKSQLIVTRDTTCQFLPDDTVNVTLDNDDDDFFLRDGDFAIRDQEELSQFQIDSIMEVNVYEGCTTKGCRLKKMRNGICPNCEGVESQTTFYGKVLVCGKDNWEKELALFQNDMEKLFGKQETNKSEEIIASMVDQLPISFHAKWNGTNIYNLQR